MREFATQTLIDKARDFRFIADEQVESGSLEEKCTRAVLGNHGFCCRLLGEEGDFADEVALFQVCDLTSAIVTFRWPAQMKNSVSSGLFSSANVVPLATSQNRPHSPLLGPECWYYVAAKATAPPCPRKFARAKLFKGKLELGSRSLVSDV